MAVVQLELREKTGKCFTLDVSRQGVVQRMVSERGNISTTLCMPVVEICWQSDRTQMAGHMP